MERNQLHEVMENIKDEMDDIKDMIVDFVFHPEAVG